MEKQGQECQKEKEVRGRKTYSSERENQMLTKNFVHLILINGMKKGFQKRG